MRTRTTLALKVASGLACCALAACGVNGGSVPLASGSSGTSGSAATGDTTGSVTGSASTTGASGGTTGAAGTASGVTTGTSGVSTGTSGTVSGTSGVVTGTSGASTGASGAVASDDGGGSDDAGTGPGSGDASSPMGSGDGGAGCAGAVFCDGFENAATLAADTDWKVDNSLTTNVVEIVTNKAHNGSNSVHLGFATTASFATYIDETKGFPNTSYWGRVWYFVMNSPEAGHQVYVDGTDGTNLTMYGVRPLNTQGSGMIAVNVDPGVGGKGETGGTSTVAMPQGMWTCFEWQVTGVGSTGNVTLYMATTSDVAAGKMGAEVPNTAAMGVPIPALIEQRIGYERYGTGTAGDIWMDDYAIGTARIGCN